MKKIALIGGPATGKTSVLNILTEAVRPTYRNKTVFIPEAATEIINSTPKSVISEMTPLIFQFEVYKVQCEKERVTDYEYILCDRGAADAFVYLSEDEAKKLISETKDEILMRYDIVVFFFGAQDNFANDTVSRREDTYEAVKLLEQKSWDVWKEHPNLFITKQHQTVYKKALNVANTLNNALGTDLFDLDAIKGLEIRKKQEAQ